MFWTSFGVIFSKKLFCPVFHGGSSLPNVFKKIKKNSKFQKQPKSYPNFPKVFWTCFGVIFWKKLFCPVFHVGSSLRNVFKKSKNFQNSKNAQNCSQVVQKCFEHVLGYYSKSFFLPSVPCRVESSKWSQKIKIFQNSKKAQSRSQKCPNMFWTSFGVIFSKKLFCPVFHGGSSLPNVFKNI